MNCSALTKEDLLAYYVNTDKCLSDINLPWDAMICGDVNCKDVNHQRDIFSLYQIKSNQITFIVTSPQHKCLGE